MSTQTALLKVMSDAVRKAAKGLTRDFGELGELQVSKKGPADYVSAADMKAEQVLFEALTAARPGYGFLGEERGLIEGTDKTHTWIADPLDGTTNFLHAIPHFACTVALERDGQIVAGVTYNPITNELFWAEKGKGCFVNDKRFIYFIGPVDTDHLQQVLTFAKIYFKQCIGLQMASVFCVDQNITFLITDEFYSLGIVIRRRGLHRFRLCLFQACTVRRIDGCHRRQHLAIHILRK